MRASKGYWVKLIHYEHRIGQINKPNFQRKCHVKLQKESLKTLQKIQVSWNIFGH